MLKLLKQYKKILIILSFPYIYLMLVLTAPTELAVTAPGGLNQVDEQIVLEGIEMSDNFNTVYVYSYYPLTPFQSWLLAGDETMDINLMTERQKDTSMRDDYLQGQVSKHVSLKTALIQAYELASLEDHSIEIDYHYAGLYVYYRPSRIAELEIGDEIVEINGESYLDYAHEDFILLAYQDEVSFKIKRTHNEEISYVTVDYTYIDSDSRMIFYPNYTIVSAVPAYTFPGLDSVVGGPSGGLVNTLTIYVSLLGLNIGDLVLAGTGTIEMDGTVGRIGGITQKIYTAIYENVDIFFIPESHFSEISSIDYPYEIVRVETIEQAVLWLNERFN
jgi:Lon-like protease